MQNCFSILRFFNNGELLYNWEPAQTVQQVFFHSLFDLMDFIDVFEILNSLFVIENIDAWTSNLNLCFSKKR